MSRDILKYDEQTLVLSTHACVLVSVRHNISPLLFVIRVLVIAFVTWGKVSCVLLMFLGPHLWIMRRCVHIHIHPFGHLCECPFGVCNVFAYCFYLVMLDCRLIFPFPIRFFALLQSYIISRRSLHWSMIIYLRGSRSQIVVWAGGEMFTSSVVSIWEGLVVPLFT